jgi:hypothetical protein
MRRIRIGLVPALSRPHYRTAGGLQCSILQAVVIGRVKQSFDHSISDFAYESENQSCNWFR